MKRNTLLLFVVLMLSAQAEAQPRPTSGGPMDATVETSSGKAKQLKSLWTKPTVVFYEDRDSTALNQHVKDALFKTAKERNMLDSVGVVAIANVSDFNWFPARNFVLAAVRDIEKQVKVPVYLDFAGSLVAPPWNLPSKTSTVVVMNTEGHPVLQLKGKLSEKEVATVIDTLGTMAQGPTQATP
jgi:hypothetical protein